MLEQELWRHARIRFHHGKTAVWNRGGEVPVNVETLEAAARRDDPTATVWKGDVQSVPADRGITILGAPVGTPEFVTRQLEKKVSEHEELLNRIRDIKDLHCAWFVLLYCATVRANYFLRTVGPEHSHVFAVQHDAPNLEMFLHVARSRSGSNLVLRQGCGNPSTRSGRIGLRSAVKSTLGQLGGLDKDDC